MKMVELIPLRVCPFTLSCCSNLLFQIRCYPRGSKLDNTFANIQKVPSQVLLLNTFRDILLVFCIDSHVMLFSLERKNTQSSKSELQIREGLRIIQR